MNDQYYIHILEKELLKRKSKNALYSMRAFSKSLAINSGVLSLIMSGKRVPSLRQINALADKIDISPSEKEAMIESVVEAQRNRPLQRMAPDIRKYKLDKSSKSAEIKFKKLEDDYYHSVSDWYCFTILEMTRLSGFKSSHKWIATELDISELEVKVAIDRLVNIGLLSQDSEGNVKAVDQQLRLDEMYNATSVARRKKQKQIREKAIESLDSDAIDKRSMTSMTMCVDIDLLPQAKKLIADFNEAMCQLLESGKKEKVYAMEVSLFPLQK